MNEMIPPPAPLGTGFRPDFKALYRKLEDALASIERSDDTGATMADILVLLVGQFRDELGFENGRCYTRHGDDFILTAAYPDPDRAPIGYCVPRDYPPHCRVLSEGLLIVQPDDPSFDARIEGIIGVSSTFAAITVGEGTTHVLAFSVSGEIHEEQILYSLNAVRHVITLKLAHQRLTGILEESRKIQESLLPSGPPNFEGYDIAGRSVPTDIVGGDLYDYLILSDRLLGVAVGDVSGHGLPAALLARDVVTALRVGMDEDLKVARVMERLNRVIHRAALSSRFVSVFYGELDSDGGFIYCNAGHHPPLLRRAGEFRELDRGGLVLGPNPNARYDRGHVHLERGDAVVLYTDGIIERADALHRQFGVERLRELLLGLEDADAAHTVDAIFTAVDTHASGVLARDDMTVVVVRRV